MQLMKCFKYMPIAALLFISACASTTKDEVASAKAEISTMEEEAALDRPSFSASQSMMVSAVVEAIDHETRVVTVRKPDGEEITFTASEEARNLDQVKVGDVLIAEYVESVSIDVMANDGLEADAAEITAMTRTEEGEMPGFAAMGTSVVVATVEEINVEMNTFKLKGPDGTVSEYVARNPDNLTRAVVGDLVIITVTEAVAISVEPQPAN
jgi:hypothetical protein